MCTNVKSVASTADPGTPVSSGDVTTPAKGKDVVSEEADDVAVTPVVATPRKLTKDVPTEHSKLHPEEPTKRTVEVCNCRTVCAIAWNYQSLGQYCAFAVSCTFTE